MPWPSAAVAIATPSSCVISYNIWFPYVCLGEANTLAPLPSLEEPPATSYAVVSFFPLSVSLLRGSRTSVAEPNAGAVPVLRRVWAALASLARVCGPPDLFGPAQLVE